MPRTHRCESDQIKASEPLKARLHEEAEEALAAARDKKGEARVAVQSAKLNPDNPGAARQARRMMEQADAEVKLAQERLSKAKEDVKALEESKKEKEKTEKQ